MLISRVIPVIVIDMLTIVFRKKKKLLVDQASPPALSEHCYQVIVFYVLSTGLFIIYIRVRFFHLLFSSTDLMKFHMIALGQGILKLFFFWVIYFSNNPTSKFGIPCNKVLKSIFFLKYSRVTHQKTRIGPQNSNIESIFISVEYCLIGKRKTMLFKIFRISQLFYFLCSKLSIYLKNDLIIEFSVSMRVF